VLRITASAPCSMRICAAPRACRSPGSVSFSWLGPVQRPTAATRRMRRLSGISFQASTAGPGDPKREAGQVPAAAYQPRRARLGLLALGRGQPRLQCPPARARAPRPPMPVSEPAAAARGRAQA
jgi:hypothetical protein